MIYEMLTSSAAQVNSSLPPCRMQAGPLTVKCKYIIKEFCWVRWPCQCVNRRVKCRFRKSGHRGRQEDDNPAVNEPLLKDQGAGPCLRGSLLIGLWSLLESSIL